jgi:hypothetical protein
MKFCFLALVFFFTIYQVNANVLIPNQVTINELYFTEDGFKLELFCYNFYDEEATIDSIVIASNSSAYVFHEHPFTNENFIWVLDNTSFERGFSINREGDYIRVSVYQSWMGEEEFSILSGVSFNSSTFPSKEYSLAYFNDFINYVDDNWSFYSLDKSPTIGMENDTIGAVFTMKGKVYNYKDELVKNYESLELYFPFSTDDEGNYETHMLACDFQFSFINSVGGPFYDIQPLQENALPGTMVNLDIHITEEVELNALNEQKNKTQISVYPNPASEYITVQTPSNTGKEEIIITNVQGREVHRAKIAGEKTIIEINNTFTVGMYNATLVLEGEIIAKQQFLINTF